MARLRELQEALSAGIIALEISSPNSRVAALQTRWDRLRAGLGLILDQRGGDMADLPGGASGLLCRDYKGKKADKLVTRIDRGLLLAGRRTSRSRAAGGRGLASGRPAWRSPSRRRLAGGDHAGHDLYQSATRGDGTQGARIGEIARGGRPGGSNVASPQPAARHGEPTHVFPANAAAADGRPRMDSVICGSGIHRLRARLDLILDQRSATIALEISSRNSRVAAIQKRWDRPRSGLDLIFDQRGVDMADLTQRR